MSARKSRTEELAQEHEVWRQRMQACTEELRKRRERSEDVWGVKVGHFKDGSFSPSKEGSR